MSSEFQRSRVLVVTPWFPSERKPGSGAFILRDVDLLQTDHDVTVLHLAEQKDMNQGERLRLRTESGAEVIRQPFSPLNPLSVIRATRTIDALISGADIVHTMAMHALAPVRLARPKVPWVHTEHWSGLMQDSLPLKKRVGLTVYGSSLSRPDSVIAVSRTLATAVGRFRGDNIRVIGNHVLLGEPDRLPQSAAQRGAEPLRLVAIGNLIDHKGPMQALEALGILRDGGLPAVLTWVGTGPLADDLRIRAHDLGLDKAFELTGQLSPDQIPEALLAAHIFILPTLSETFGVAFAEALGHGLPVVATGRGAHLDFLPPEASRIAPERDPETLASAVLSLIEDDELWDAERIMAYAHAAFSHGARLAAYREVYAARLK